jgi:hypothetical membrane protein
LKVQNLSRQQKIAGITGLIAPIFAFVCILFAVASWQQFSWTDNALSDLGIQNGVTATVFNSGLVISGLLFIAFATGLFRFAGNRLVGKVGAAVFALACVMLVAIGIFNENYSPTHYIVSVGLFMLLPISLLILVTAFWVEGKHKTGVFTLATALFAAAVWVLEFTVPYVSGVAIPETASGLAGAIWVCVLSYLILEKAKKQNPPSKR